MSVRKAGPARVRCPRCGAQVIRTPRGELLELEPHPLAIDLPDGGRLTLHQAAAAAVGRTPPKGHHVHIAAPGYGCHPAAAVQQLALFTTAA
ncbi:hypothetical protein ACGRHY_29970 [Streptomyces sp. HK10]|uniref:hypothetical protein n=1 Tax=Streptomyces sp. HK10 TaxID=3373255 RepID=UPI003749CD27